MYLKTTFESVEYNAVNGFEKDNQRLELVEDANGDFFVGEIVKSNSAFKEILSSLNKMKRVSKITFKVSDDESI